MATYKLQSKGDERGLILRCACHLNEHEIDFLYWVNDREEEEMYISPHLYPHPFWQRLWLGIKYILGYRSRYGDYAGLVLWKQDIEELRAFLDCYLLDVVEREHSG